MKYLRRAFNHLAYLTSKRLLVRRIVLLAITVSCAGYAYIGLWIILHRPRGFITKEEVALILSFAGLNGVVFAAYNKRRSNPQQEVNDEEDFEEPAQESIRKPPARRGR